MRTMSRVFSGAKGIGAPTAPLAKCSVSGSCGWSSSRYSHGRTLSPYFSCPVARMAGSSIRVPLTSTGNATGPSARVSTPVLVDRCRKFWTEKFARPAVLQIAKDRQRRPERRAARDHRGSDVFYVPQNVR
jgi:hypothetical protein